MVSRRSPRLHIAVLILYLNLKQRLINDDNNNDDDDDDDENYRLILIIIDRGVKLFLDKSETSF